jgi:hypothetical protein
MPMPRRRCSPSSLSSEADSEQHQQPISACFSLDWSSHSSILTIENHNNRIPKNTESTTYGGNKISVIFASVRSCSPPVISVHSESSP